MIRACYLLGIWFALFSGLVQGQAQVHSPLDVISGNIITQRVNDIDTIKLKHEAAKWSGQLQGDGSWADIDYGSRERGKWEPSDHIKRIRVMAEAYMLMPAGLPQLHTNIEKAVSYWINRKPEPKSDNWWFETIGLPTDIGYILLFMQKAPLPLSSDAVNGLLTWMKKSRRIETQTKTELNRMIAIGMHYIMRGCVTRDESLVQMAVKYINQMMEPDSGYTGIQADYSFHAHGPQLYIQGYGTTFLQRIAEVSEILSGTPYTLSKKNFQEVLNYAHSTFYKVARGKYIDYTVLGRNVARVGILNAGHRLAPIVKTYEQLDAPDQRKHYEAAFARFTEKQAPGYGITPEHLQLWSSDYTAHIRPEYFVGVRMVSTRTVKPERGNGENLLEHFRGNGAMSVMVRGNEYENIFPVWKWNQIPGTTTPAMKDVSGQPEWFFNKGKTDFVGGVTDGEYGAAVYDMNDYETEAKKSWFFFDRAIVCLGAGITSSHDAPVFTTINQNLSNNDIVVSRGNDTLNLKGDSVWSNVTVSAVQHGEIGYYFPNQQTVQLSNIYQEGSWNRINKNLSKEKISARVFTLYINHGYQPKAAAYSYSVWPGIRSLKEIQPERFSILSNSEKIQAVYNAVKDIVQVVFYEPGNLSFGDFIIKTDQPCTILLRDLKAAAPVIYVADPTQKLKRVEIELEKRAVNFRKHWSIRLPEGKMAGKSVRID